MRIREWFSLSNWKLMLLSAFLALFLWIYVVSAEAPQMERVLSAPLQVVNLKDGLALAQAPSDVSLRMRTPVRMDISSENVRAFLDLDQLEEGQHMVPVSLDAIPGATILEVRPDNVLVQLEKVESQEMSVEIVFLGKLPQGFTLGSDVRIDPPTVTLSAPRSTLSKAQRVLATLDLGGVTTEISQTVSVRVLGKDGLELAGVKVEPNRVNISATVNLESIFKTVPIVPRFGGTPASGFVVKSVACDPQIITLEGTADILARIDTLSTFLLNLEGARDSFEQEVYLDLRQVEARPVEETLVVVKIEIEEEAQKELSLPISLQGGGQNVRMEPTSVNIIVAGPLSIVEGLNSRDFFAYVDLANLEAGSYILPLKIELPSGVVLLKAEPATIQVEIR